jgi:hypothetical protein
MTEEPQFSLENWERLPDSAIDEVRVLAVKDLARMPTPTVLRLKNSGGATFRTAHELSGDDLRWPRGVQGFVDGDELTVGEWASRWGLMIVAVYMRRNRSP